MRAPIVVAGLLSVLALSACETTQQTSARLQKAQAKATTKEKGLSIDRTNPDITVSEATVLSDENGTAVVATLKSKSKDTLLNVPVAITVQDSSGKAVFRNNEPGADPALVGLSVLKPGDETFWVNDQVLADGTPAEVETKTGKGTVAPGSIPKITASAPHVTIDPNAGNAANGTVTNASKIDQRGLTLFAVARRGGKLVAAGRGTIELLRAGKKAPYEIFFTGNPKGADVTIEALPSTFK